ncbi:MAG TPA: tRNA (adenosine(37)-N6)-dimethylallyltransferase MiaA [Gammaproteobacteria bacterium]|nr:tRNA (adenosine(37)-N6)-dimethylallyltransferase MiaA [Gammaproteobacteria bacterium]
MSAAPALGGRAGRARPVIFLMGPTASGKSGLAVQLARRYPVEIVSVDSAQVYRGMDIGTAKPSRELRTAVPHHLVDILDPARRYSAGRFRTDALACIEAILARRRVPLLVGGTMLYFRALQGKVDDLPPADPAVREALREEARRFGWEALHRRLAGIDPEAAGRIHPNDPQRIQRALELYRLTGLAPTELYRRQGAQSREYRITRVIVSPSSRALLHQRIARRFHDMLEQGFIDEVRALRARADLNPEIPSMRAVGYRQLWEYLDARRTRDEAIARGIAATRQLAKRQLTWLRREREAVWLDSSDPGLAAKTAERLGAAIADGGMCL